MGDKIQRHTYFHSSNEESTIPSADDLLRALEVLGAGVVSINRGSSVIYANTTAHTFLNATAGQLIGRLLYDLVPDGFGRLLKKKVEPALNGLTGDAFEAWCPAPIGRRLRCRCLPSSWGAMVVLEDITSQDTGQGIRGTKQSTGAGHGPAHTPGKEGLMPADQQGRYKALFDSMSQGILEYDAQGRLVAANRAAVEIFGVEVEKAQGCSVREVLASIPEISREDGTAFDAGALPVLTSLATGREVMNSVMRVVFPGKQAHQWFRHDAIPWFKPAGGGLGGVFGIFSDITDMKNIQDALSIVNENLERTVQEVTDELQKTILVLEKQKETLKTIFDSIPVMLVFHDPLRQTSMANHAFERLTGWPLAGDGLPVLLEHCFPDPGRRQEVWDFIKAASGTWKDFDITTRSGELLTSSWLSVRLSDGSLVGVGVDLRLCRLCTQIGSDLAKFAAAVEQVREGIALVNIDGTVEYINPAFESITGYTRLEAVGLNICSFVDYSADEQHNKIFDAVVSQQKPWSGTQKRRRKGGEIFDAHISVSPIRDDTGRVVNYVLIVRDVTHEAAALNQLQQTRKMEALGALAGGIAHDLKNVFSPILLDTETLMQDMGVHHPFYPVLDEIHKATTLGIELVNQIRTFSHSTPRTKEPLDLYPLVRKFLSFLRSIMSPMIDIDHHLCPKGAVVMADATQIQQVLMNLCINARHAMRRKGGLLTVRLANVDLDEKAAAEVCPVLIPGPYVEIVVEDTGEGMDDVTVERIFEPFFTTKKPGEGSGMGLAVVHGIVTDHAGAISVSTSPGKDSSFRVLLPRLPESALMEKPNKR